jgi:hypothetical protein
MLKQNEITSRDEAPATRSNTKGNPDDELGLDGELPKRSIRHSLDSDGPRDRFAISVHFVRGRQGMTLVEQSRVPLNGALGGGPADARNLGFDVEAQQQAQWCWAAVAVSVASFYQPDSAWTQCGVAHAELRTTDCCTRSGPCDRPWYLDRALQRVGQTRRRTSSGGVSGERATPCGPAPSAPALERRGLRPDSSNCA